MSLLGSYRRLRFSNRICYELYSPISLHVALLRLGLRTKHRVSRAAMVQMRRWPDRYAASRGPILKDYWKLYDHGQAIALCRRASKKEREKEKRFLKANLDKKDFAYPEDSSRARLIYLNIRADRYLMSYGKRPIAELRAFVTQRKLGRDVARDMREDQLVQLLEQGDEQQTFPKFLTLPAEIRVLVYNFHIADVTRLQTPENYISPPPITRVSRQARAESLPIFYPTRPLHCKLEVCMHQRDDNSYNNFRGSGLYQLPTKIDFKKLIPSAPEGKVVDYKRVMLFCHMRIRDSSGATSPCQYSFRWYSKPTPTGITFPERGKYHRRLESGRGVGIVDRRFDEVATQIDSRISLGLRDVFQEMASREGEYGLGEEDISAIEKLFNNVFVAGQGFKR